VVQEILVCKVFQNKKEIRKDNKGSTEGLEMTREEKIKMMRMASHAISGPYKKSSIAWRIGSWTMFWACFFALILFAAYARADSLVILGGTQAPISGWTSDHKYKTTGIGLYRTYFEGDHVELEAGLIYQMYLNGTSGSLLGLDLMLTTRGKLYAGFNAGFGLLSPRQFQDVGDQPCALGSRFGPIVGYQLSNCCSLEMRIDHLSAFTPHDKGRNHLVLGLKWSW